MNGDVTDADRETAATRLAKYVGVIGPGPLRHLTDEMTEVIAAERRRVVEPFETLAATFTLIAAGHFEKADGEDYRAGLGDGYESAAAHLYRVLRELDGRPGSEGTGDLGPFCCGECLACCEHCEHPR